MDPYLIHGRNLQQKELSAKKYSDEESKAFLREIRGAYDRWHSSNMDLIGPLREVSVADVNLINSRVRLFEEYKQFLDQQKFAEKFDSRSNLHSSLLEEFLYYLFKDLVADFPGEPLIGKSHSFKDIFFKATSFQNMLQESSAQIEIKDHDFTVGVSLAVQFSPKGIKSSSVNEFQIPVIAIECKTYLDKTMLEGASNAAQQLKIKNPDAMYIIVAEWLKLTEKINLKKYMVDQIYILRKQKNTDREFRFLDGYVKNPIYADVVFKLFEDVRLHLTQDWRHTSIESGLSRGYLLE